ncbi:three-helix bundle dimerization domain-containing protein [Demequina pelophila]|uniref:three-helix bundle dimerization domain-containing protein n=1 Tax=Demequina pelophila TaxID=1638984 RepID=UPI000B20741B|nr:hypothetical protein [Demequina pelophila]
MTTTLTRIDRTAALSRSTERLVAEFEGEVPAARVSETLAAAYVHRSAHATIHGFLPLLAEREARAALNAQVQELHPQPELETIYAPQPAAAPRLSFDGRPRAGAPVERMNPTWATAKMTIF